MTASQAQQTRRVGLCLNPLDVLFFRDGRPFEAASRAYGGLPLPRHVRRGPADRAAPAGWVQPVVPATRSGRQVARADDPRSSR